MVQTLIYTTFKWWFLGAPTLPLTSPYCTNFISENFYVRFTPHIGIILFCIISFISLLYYLFQILHFCFEHIKFIACNVFIWRIYMYFKNYEDCSWLFGTTLVMLYLYHLHTMRLYVSWFNPCMLLLLINLCF
jgi:hypothetical protein